MGWKAMGWNRLRIAIEKKRFAQSVRRIRQTAALRMQEPGPAIVTMLCKRDIDPYLLAFKSLYRHLNRGNALVLNDGSLDRADQQLLAQHIPWIEFRDLAAVDTGSCPQGGCWERLFTLVEVSQRQYAMQLDADILVMRPVEEVNRLIEQPQAFALTNLMRPGICTLRQASAYTRASTWAASAHVQPVSETAFERLENADQRYYLRGSAAFTGIPAGRASIDTVVAFSDEMRRLIGEQWRQWGSEQVACNYLIANLDGAEELPCPKYANSMPHIDILASALGHFFGTQRYIDGRYRQAAERVIGELLAGGH